MTEVDEIPDVLELLRVQQRAPAPREQDYLRYGTPQFAPPRPSRPSQAQPRNSPVPQQPVAPQQAAPAQVEQPDELPDALDMIRGGSSQVEAQPQTQAQPMPQPSIPGSKLGATRGDRVREAIMGKADSKYGKLPNISTVLQNEGELSYGGEMGRWAVGASDDDMAKGYGRMLGPRFLGIEKDANGYPVIAYKAKDGQIARAYVNNPGLDMQDVARGVTGALPFAKVAQIVSAVGQGAPLAGRMLVQGAGQAVTSIAQDATAVATDVSPLNFGQSAIKAGLSAVGGVGGEMVGEFANVIRQGRTARRMYDKNTQTLTPEGQAAAQAAGVDPTDLTGNVAEDFAKAFAKSGDPDAAFRQTVSNEFGIRRTAGEIAGSRNKLLREQQYRGGTYGDAAESAMKNFDDLQRADISKATRGVVPQGTRNVSIAERIAPARRDQLAGERMGKTEAGENLVVNNQSAFRIAKEQENAIWERVPRFKATPETLGDLDKAVAARTADVFIDAEVTPMAAKMAQGLDRFKSGEAPTKAAQILQNSAANDITTMRKRLLAMRQSAATPEDKRAARAVYDAFLDWEVVAAEKSGDIMGASLSRIAREHTRTLHEIFDGQSGSPAANILKTVFKGADSPEQIVNSIFSGPASQIKNGAPTAIRQLNRAYDTYLEPAAAMQAKQDLGLAYWLRMTADRGNEVKTPGQLATAIKTMLGDQKSLAREVYSPQTIASMRRLASAMDEIKQKNPNTSWSAVGMGALMRDVGGAMLKTIGWDSVLGRTAAGVLAKPVSGTYGKVQASRATGNLQGASAPSLSAPPYGAGIGGIYGNQSQQ